MKYLALLTFGFLGLLPLACKDTDPCDPGEEIKSTGCFPIKASGGTGGKPASAEGGDRSVTEGGADAAGGAETAAGGAGEPMVEPWGNPNATWGGFCETNAECGPDAPICATFPYNYCSQIDCQDGERNAGICPDGWSCFKYMDFPAICVKK